MNKQKPRNREYRTPPQLRLNQERASKVYPHRLITPKGIGNGADSGNNLTKRFE